jgi:2-methylisocitrate lyase-like PEP mutase family enzyme
MAARNALPNTSIQTIPGVIDYETQVSRIPILPIVADGEKRWRSPVITYRTVPQLERAGAAVIMLEDSTGLTAIRRQGCRDGAERRDGRRIRRRRRPPRRGTMIMARSDRPAKGYFRAGTLELLKPLAEAGADAFFINGYTLDQQQRAKNALKKPLMIGSSGRAAEWHAKGVDMGSITSTTSASGRCSSRSRR